MKASMKFREEQKPLLRAKVPLSIIGFPFQSGIVAGESKELSLNLSTFFDSGPSFKISYRPNDSSNPFSLVFKTGIGSFGSPISSSMTMGAEFNLISDRNPSFFVHFKPQFGDFAIKKSQSSDFAKCLKPISNGDDSQAEVLGPPEKLFPGDKFRALTSESPASRVIGGLMRDVEVTARTVVPVRQRAVVKFRWGVKFPAPESEAAVVVGRANPTAGISFRNFPLLVMNKIGIEHVAEDDKVGQRPSTPESADVAAACFGVKRQLEVIQAENGMLRKAMDDLRSEMVAGKSTLPLAGGDRRGVNKNSGDRRSNGDKKSSSSESKGFGGKDMEGDVNEELKKALMGAAATSA